MLLNIVLLFYNFQNTNTGMLQTKGSNCECFDESYCRKYCKNDSKIGKCRNAFNVSLSIMAAWKPNLFIYSDTIQRQR